MDLTDPRVIEYQLRALRWKRARGKQFGQHFLVSRDALEHIVAALELSHRDTVVEIGPGLGVLTVELARRAGRVIAIEKDAAVLPVLRENLRAFSNVEVVHADAITFDPTHSSLPTTHYILAGNLPYSITIPVIERFLLESSRAPSRAIFLVQKEVAERLASPPGGKHRGAMTVLIEAVAKVEIMTFVPAEAFVPAPEVDGAIIRITPHENAEWRIQNAEFREFVFSAFRHRRKQIGAIPPGRVGKSAAEVREKLAGLGVHPRARPQELTLEQWRSLFAHFML